MTVRFVVRVLVRCVVGLMVAGVTLFAPQHLAWGAPETRLTKALNLDGGRVATVPFPATHVVLRWEGDASATVELHAAGVDGKWQPWSVAGIDEDGGATQESGFILVHDAVKLQAQVLAGNVLAGNVAHLRAYAIDADNGPRSLQVVGSTPVAKGDTLSTSAANGGTPGDNGTLANGGTGTGTPGNSVAQPTVITRAQWGADESLRKGTPEFAPIQRMDVHHTVTDNNDPDPAATVRAIYAWHVQGNGWNDIGYNFLIDQQGNIYEGRYARDYAAGETPTGEDLNNNGVVGAHTLGHNPGTVGIAMLGTFTTATPTDAAQGALTRLIAWESGRHNLDPMASGVVLGHRDLYTTECPGDAAYALLPQWRQAASTMVLSAVAPGSTPGYWVAAANGKVLPFGAATNYGSMTGAPLNKPIISMTRTASGDGYWLLGADGGIFTFGDARFYGSTGSTRLNKPVVGMAATPTGAGYWLVASDGGIFAFGDARFYGSTGSMRLNQPVVGMAPTESGKGYWMVASDGGIFTFGDATFHGSTGSMKLNKPVMSMAPAPNGTGYWLVASDGGIFTFGTKFYGAIPGMHLASYAGTQAIALTSTGRGYYLLASDGGLYTFGDARFLGSASGNNATAMTVMSALS